MCDSWVHVSDATNRCAALATKRGSKQQHDTRRDARYRMTRSNNSKFSSHLTTTEYASHKRIESCSFGGFGFFSSFQKLCRTPSAALALSCAHCYCWFAHPDALAAATYFILQHRFHVPLPLLPLRLRHCCCWMLALGGCDCHFSLFMNNDKGRCGKEEHSAPPPPSSSIRSRRTLEDTTTQRYLPFIFI